MSRSATARPQVTDRKREAVPPSKARSGEQRWLLFVHQLPSRSSNVRVRTWRRLQHLGAIPLKQAVYLLPDTPDAREDFEWLTAEVKATGGDASVFAAENVDGWSDGALIEEFRRASQDAYAGLAKQIEKVLRRPSTRRPRGTRATSIRRLLDIYRDRLAAIERADFFGSAGHDRVKLLLAQLEERTGPPGHRRSGETKGGSADADSYRNRLWVTRPRPGIDRMASAWLIRRFIDPAARFGFVPDRTVVPEDAVAFDMFGVEFSHQGEGCTFETLCAVFGISEPAVTELATIVHDLDLKDEKFRAPETATVGALIDGLQLTHTDDEALLVSGMALFDALYHSKERSTRASGPRPVARHRHSSPQRKGK